jgi:hypothetical protein
MKKVRVSVNNNNRYKIMKRKIYWDYKEGVNKRGFERGGREVRNHGYFAVVIDYE